MGNHRFKLSEMIPNAWFYKLKDMNRASSTKRSSHHLPLNPLPPPPSSHQSHKQQQQQKERQSPPLTPKRASYFFPSNSPLHPKALDTHFPLDSPRQPTRKLISPRSTVISSTTSKSESSANDIILNVAGTEFELPPIITKAPPKRKEAKKQHRHHEEQQKKKATAPPQGIQRLRMRANSPRLVTKKVRVMQRGSSSQRKSLPASFAVVKNSSDPKKDFRESMMEMITENNLRASNDLEQLLACYLSLNSNDHHDVIVEVFEEIWFDLTDTNKC